VTIEDLTKADGLRTVEYVTDTKYIVPDQLRPLESTPHIIRWMIGTARRSVQIRIGSSPSQL
jgi:hypothetical protein